MTFTTPNGTYGSTTTPNGFVRWFMARQARAIRKGRDKVMGFSALALVTTGRKSGKTYETPIAYWPQPDGSWLICASANGAVRNPGWYRNLAAAPERARIVIAGVETPVSAEELHGAERDAAWQHIIHTTPSFEDYTKKTDRLLPVIRLTARAA